MRTRARAQWRAAYDAHMLSPRRQVTRRIVLDRDRHRCVHCGRRWSRAYPWQPRQHLEVDEAYYTDPPGMEPLHAHATVCQQCHRGEGLPRRVFFPRWRPRSITARDRMLARRLRFRVSGGHTPFQRFIRRANRVLYRPTWWRQSPARIAATLAVYAAVVAMVTHLW